MRTLDGLSLISLLSKALSIKTPHQAMPLSERRLGHLSKGTDLWMQPADAATLQDGSSTQSEETQASLAPGLFQEEHRTRFVLPSHFGTGRNEAVGSGTRLLDGSQQELARRLGDDDPPCPGEEAKGFSIEVDCVFLRAGTAEDADLHLQRRKVLKRETIIRRAIKAGRGARAFFLTSRSQ